MPASPIRVMVVDDVPDLTRLLGVLINAQNDMRCVGCYPSADGLMDSMRREKPDIVLLDLTMPGMNPMTVIAEASQELPDVRIIVFSGHDDPMTVDAAVERGAWGHVAKHADAEHILDAIRRVRAGEFVLPQ